MKTFVTWTGLISVVSGCALQFSTIARQLMPSEQVGMVMHLFGGMAVFLGVMLVFSARDLKSRGVLVVWEGVLRLFGCGVMVYFGSVGDAGGTAVFSGIFDGAIGLAYLVGLPRHLDVRFSSLLFDQRDACPNQKSA
jgi:hypothetical protein